MKKSLLILFSFFLFTSGLWAASLVDNIEPYSIIFKGERFYILHTVREDPSPGSQEVFLAEFDHNFNKIKDKKLGFVAANAEIVFYQDRFYVFYTSPSNDGDIYLAIFDSGWNLIRDIPIIVTPFDSEFALSLIPAGDKFYLFYVRNYTKNCGLKMIEYTKDFQQIKETTLIEGKTDFNLSMDYFSILLVDNKFYITYQKQMGAEGIFVNCFDINGNLISQRSVIPPFGREPSSAFLKNQFYLLYQTRDPEYALYVKKFNQDWNLEEGFKIPTRKEDLGGESLSSYFLLFLEGKTYLFLHTYDYKEGRFVHQLYVKEIPI